VPDWCVMSASTPSVSICIPAYEMHGEGCIMLDRLVTSILDQDYKDVEIVVSDHSISSDVETLCSVHPSVKYVRNTNSRGSSSANINNAIKHSVGHYIKPMFQDEAFYSTHALSAMVEGIESSKKNWVVCECLCYKDDIEKTFNHFKPKWLSEQDLIAGTNTIGPPSSIMYKNNSGIIFDEKMIWLMDCDFYCRLYRQTGYPGFISEVCVLVRAWEGSVSNSVITEDLRLEEHKYITKKYAGV